MFKGSLWSIALYLSRGCSVLVKLIYLFTRQIGIVLDFFFFFQFWQYLFNPWTPKREFPLHHLPSDLSYDPMLGIQPTILGNRSGYCLCPTGSQPSFDSEEGIVTLPAETHPHSEYFSLTSTPAAQSKPCLVWGTGLTTTLMTSSAAVNVSSVRRQAWIKDNIWEILLDCSLIGICWSFVVKTRLWTWQW